MLSLEDLPDEITLKILNFVNIKDLFRCLAVNKKLRTIANDQSLWITMHLEGKMPPELLPQILAKGCQHLSLYHHEFINNESPKFAKNFQLKYLAVENDSLYEDRIDAILPELATSCYSLEKLYVYVYPKDFAKASKMMKCIIQNSQTLKVLYIRDLDERQLTMSLEAVKLIVTLCVELTELSITYTKLSQESIDFICENLTPTIEKFDIRWDDDFGDKQLKKLLNRCNKLTELNFTGTQVSNKSVSTIIEKVSPTLTNLEASCFNLSDLLKLATMPKIQVLGYDLLPEEDQKKFEEIMPHLSNEAIEKARIDDYVNIAMPYQMYTSSNPAQKVWEIEAKLRTYDGVGIWDDWPFAKNPKRKKAT